MRQTKNNSGKVRITHTLKKGKFPHQLTGRGLEETSWGTVATLPAVQFINSLIEPKLPFKYLYRGVPSQRGKRACPASGLRTEGLRGRGQSRPGRQGSLSSHPASRPSWRMETLASLGSKFRTAPSTRGPTTNTNWESVQSCTPWACLHIHSCTVGTAH